MLERLFKILTGMTDEEFKAFANPPKLDNYYPDDVDGEVARDNSYQEEIAAWENCQWYHDHHYYK